LSLTKSILGWHPNAPWTRVFGLPLVPLTLGHVFVLDRMESAVLGGDIVGLAELALAVLVCAEEPDCAQRNLRSWLRRVFFLVWTRRIIRLDVAKESEGFRAYIRHWTSAPEICGKSKSSDDFGSGWHIRLLAMLTGELGLSLEESLALTVRDANSLIAALGESRGVMKLWTKRQETFWQIAAERDQAKLEAKEDSNGSV
jgi:hypothetical protein